MKALEILFWSTGTALVMAYVLMLGWTEIERRSSLSDFALARQVAQQRAPVPSDLQAVEDGLQPASEFLPSPATTSATIAPPTDAAVAILRIRGIDLEVPVAPGTEEHVLLRGAGWIEGTAAPGSDGNVGIAAHRDSHFRGLKDVAVGDLIELDTLERTRSYRITGLSVVEPTDVQVLAETGEAVLTLVTCFPFYFVGNAPQRFIVRAVATDLGP